MNEYIAEALREGRLKKGLTQQHVAKELGVRNNTICNYEKGAFEPSLDVFAQLCKMYELNVADVMERAYGLSAQFKGFTILPSEIALIGKYRFLDNHGKDVVKTMLQLELQRLFPEEKETETESV